MTKKVPLPLPDYPLNKHLADNNLLENIWTSILIIGFCILLGWFVKLAFEPKKEEKRGKK